MPTRPQGAATQQLVFNLKSLKTALELCVNLVCSTEAANDDEEDEVCFHTPITLPFSSSKIFVNLENGCWTAWLGAHPTVIPNIHY